MLWDLIRDFFVQYIFGGTSYSGDVYTPSIGGLGEIFLNDLEFTFFGNSYNIADWLSTTATIIVMCLIIWFFIKLTIYFFKQGAGLFKW